MTMNSDHLGSVEGWGSPPYPCPACEGEGRVLMNAGLHSTGPTHIAICPRCDGTGTSAASDEFGVSRDEA